MIGGVAYERVDDEGLHITTRPSEKGGTPEQRLLAVDTVVVCAGQTPLHDLEAPLQAEGAQVFRIGGAHVAAELDAKRAIDQGSRLAAALEEATPEKVGTYVAPLGWEGWLFDKVMSRKKAAR